MAEEMEASICECDYEPFDFYHVTHPIARKAYICCECAEVIQPGIRHERAATKYDGHFECFRTCVPCSQIRKDYCSPYTALRETLWEMLRVDYLTGAQFEEDDDGER